MNMLNITVRNIKSLTKKIEERQPLHAFLIVSASSIGEKSVTVSREAIFFFFLSASTIIEELFFFFNL